MKTTMPTNTKALAGANKNNQVNGYAAFKGFES